MKKIRDEAKTAANQIRAKQQVPEASIPAILRADCSVVPDAPQVQFAALQSVDWDTPWILPKCDAVQLGLGDGQLQKSMTTFAMQCKKSQELGARQEHCFQDSAVKVKVDKLLGDFLPKDVLDISKVCEGGDKFMQSTWLCAFAADMNFVGLPPNGAAQLRVHAAGTMECLVIDLLTRAAFAKTEDGKAMTLTQLQKQLDDCDTEAIKKCMGLAFACGSTPSKRRKPSLCPWELP